MNVATKKAVGKPRPVTISCRAAQLLGHTRTAKTALTTRSLTIALPAFNTQELVNALSELLDKQLISQKGRDDNATYALTDYGREGRIAVR